jgi:CheY-like chemotaxis protein
MSRLGLFSVGSLTGIHILLVDEDPASRAELTAILQYCGSLLTVADSGSEAVKVLRLTRPDIVVIGVERHHRGEIPFVRVLRTHASPRVNAIPVVAIVWPDDSPTVAGELVVELRRPLNAWEVCRALATAVTVE